MPGNLGKGHLEPRTGSFEVVLIFRQPILCANAGSAGEQISGAMAALLDAACVESKGFPVATSVLFFVFCGLRQHPE